jgi:hypothetical protein
MDVGWGGEPDLQDAAQLAHLRFTRKFPSRKERMVYKIEATQN